MVDDRERSIRHILRAKKVGKTLAGHTLYAIYRPQEPDLHDQGASISQGNAMEACSPRLQVRRRIYTRRRKRHG